MKNLIINDLKAPVPIIQGGMGVSVSLSGLAAAVANEGGIGVISATGIGMKEEDFFSSFMKANKRILLREISEARKKTSGIIGVNLMVALSDYDELLRASYDAEVDIVFVGAGLPLRLPDTISIDIVKNAKTKFVPIVSSARAAKIIFKSWEKNYNYVPDAIVVEGPLAGGHLGFNKEQLASPEVNLDQILTEVIDVITGFESKYEKSIPVIAAGGIYDGSDIHRVMKLGASGVQMGTRFVATDECDASNLFKEVYVNSKKEDIKIIKSPVGLLGRAIENDFLKSLAAGNKRDFKCPCRCLKSCDIKTASYCIALALVNAKEGNLADGFAFAGQNAYRIDKIVPVKTLFNQLIKEYQAAADSS
jgi:NAD(P)H-dependent flavin oxidoreductase YrpB (nitropropane dioxygenase family)